MTAKRRASETRKNPFIEAVTPAPKTEPATVSSAPAADVSGGFEVDEKLSKYTALLDNETAAAFDGLALMARRKLGRKVDKSQLLRAMVLLTADDAAVRDMVLDFVGRRG